MATPQNIMDLYLRLAAGTEPPTIFHRWSLLTSVGAFLERQFYLPFGNMNIYPNIYCMLIGEPATRKSTSILRSKSMMVDSGFLKFSATKTRKEKFLLDLAGVDEEQPTRRRKDSEVVMENLFGSDLNSVEGMETADVFIVAPEFNNFLPTGDLEFLSDIGDLWDWDQPKLPYTYRLKNSRSVAIYQPTISLLGGNTHSGFQEMFPPQSIGQGFLSRCLLVFSEPTGHKVTIPPPFDTTPLVLLLKEIKAKVVGKATYEEDAYRALDVIYRTWPEMEDQRFKYYCGRRFTHLLKLVLVCTACRASTRIILEDVVWANTILCYAESFMPKALGEFGKSRHSEASNKIMTFLNTHDTEPQKLPAIWKVVHQDLDKMKDLAELITNLLAADKIQQIKGGGYLPKKKPLGKKLLFVDFKLLKEFTT